MPGAIPDAAAASVTGVVLAGGQGRRMGGADKGLVAYRGRPLVEWALDVMRPQVGRLLISANRHLDRYSAYGFPVVTDTLSGFQGPLAGVLAAFDVVETPWLAVVPCDTPHLPADLVARLLGAAQGAGVPLAVAADDARTHHSCFVVEAAQRATLAAFLERGERAVRRWIDGMPHVSARFDAVAFANLNHLPDGAVDDAGAVGGQESRGAADA